MAGAVSVAWSSCAEAVQARLRNAVREVLRKLAYPPLLRDGVADRILALVKQAPPGS